MKQNLIKMLKEKAEKQYGINRDQIDKEFQLNFTQADKEYREFLTEQLYLKKLFMIFSQENIKKLIEDQKAKDKIFRDQICNIINVIAILKKIDDYAGEIESKVLVEKENVDFEENNKAVKARNFRLELISLAQKQYKYFMQFLDMFQSLVLQIQVSSYNGKQLNLQNLYFPNHPVFEYLAPDSKDTIMFQVSRDTPRDKLISLLGNYQNVKQQIQWNYSMKYYTPKLFSYQLPLSITSSLINQIRITARYVSYLICLLMLYFIVVDHDTIQKTSYFTYYNYNDKLLMKIICGVQLTLTVVFFTLWLKMRSYLSWKKYIDAGEGKEDEGKEEMDVGEEREMEEEEDTDSWLGKLKKVVRPVKQKLTGFGQFVQEQLITIKLKIVQNILYQKLISPIVNFVIYLFQVIAGLHTYESGFLSILVFVISSFLGNFIGVQWYTMHIFDFFVGISLLTNVFKAIVNNIKLLTLLSGLAGCFILVFNIISLNTYVPVIYQQKVPSQSCQDFLGCVLQLYTSGAIGDDMDQLYIGRFVFDTLYVVFMQMIFQGLVGGMIIDSFMGLKQEDAERDADKKTFCYICAMSKPDIQKSGSTFTKHTSHHFLWNYLFYIYCLKLKDQTDYTGIQYTITNKINEEDVTWFPDNGEKDMSGEIQNLVIQLKQKVGQFKGKIQGLNVQGKESIDFVKGRCLEVYDKNKMIKEDYQGMLE